MSLPPNNHRCWQRLASGGLASVKTNFLGLQLMVTRLSRSPATPAAKEVEIRTFFTKYEHALGNEIEQLAKL